MTEFRKTHMRAFVYSSCYVYYKKIRALRNPAYRYASSRSNL